MKNFIDDVPLPDFYELERAFGNKRYGNVSKDIIDYLIKLYDAEIMYVDSHIGKLLRKLDELGIKDDTLIIITADHGEEFYEHGSFGHSETLYQEIIRVPLMIYYPKEFEPQRIEKRVSLVDVFPTILDTLQIEIPEDVEGISMLPLLKGKSTYDREYTLSEVFGREGIDETLQQQAIIIGVLSALYHLVTFWLQHLLTDIYFLFDYLWPVFSSTLFWLWIFPILRKLRRQIGVTE